MSLPPTAAAAAALYLASSLTPEGRADFGASSSASGQGQQPQPAVGAQVPTSEQHPSAGLPWWQALGVSDDALAGACEALLRATAKAGPRQEPSAPRETKRAEKQAEAEAAGPALGSWSTVDDY